jgi:hypothetical protein
MSFCLTAFAGGAGVLAAGAVALAADGQACVPEAGAKQPSARSMLLRAAISAMGERGRDASLCFVNNPTPEELENIMTRFQALPPGLSPFDSRYFTATPVWTGSGGQGSSGTATKANLTYSFPADNVTWGDGQNGPSAPNNLHASFMTLFGSGNEDHGFELIRQALTAWHRFNGINYTEVADDNVAFTSSTSHVATRGDIRIGANPQGTSSGVLAYDHFPSGGSDMTINSDYFPASQLALGLADNNYRYLRNVVSHEHGHGLGFIHPVPCNATKLMEPFINLNFETTQIDEKRGAGRNYGDRWSGNSSGAAAADFGNLTTPFLRSVVERNLSTNGSAVSDWFKFTIDSAQDVMITVAPTGSSYTEGQQTSGCSGTTATVNAQQAGNLNFELRNGSNGTTILQTAAGMAAGSNETMTMPALGAGTYWVRVFDSANSGSANQIVQLYDMTLRVGPGATTGGGAKAPPVAVAGLSKRVLAGANCYFIGDINSYVTDTGPGGGANALTYAWDLDGNGTFGGGLDSTSSEPVFNYPSNGSYTVKLRVTDSNALSSTDTITVTVFGGNASLLSVIPSSVDPGVSTPVVINGVNLKGISNASQFTASGSGVTFTGTPTVNYLGTQVTGLNVMVAAGASAGLRDVIVTNSDASGTSSGNATAPGMLNVTGGCSPPMILAQPQSHTDICVNTTILLNVGATGGTFTYQWRKNGTPIPNATASVYTIQHLNAATVGFYDVVVTNACGPTTSNAVEQSIDTAAITTQPSSQSACLGSMATFSVGTTGTVDLQWQKDGADISGATGPQLVISPVTADSVGMYTCTVVAPCDTFVTQGATLSLGGALSVGTQPQSQSVCEGGAATLSFGVGSATSFQWRKDGVEISDATSSSLQLSPAALTDAGNYDCVAMSDCGTVTSNVATVSVCSAVAIAPAGQPAAVAACTGGNASFTVTATGSSLAYQWRKGGQPIGGATSATLAFNPAAATDAGTYDCIVSNCCQSLTSASATLSLCAADYNCSGTLTVQDIFDFLSGWFAGDARADFNGVNGLTVQDIFDFLNAWFIGC